VSLRDITAQTLQIALQGRESARILSRFYGVEDIPYYGFRKFGKVIVSRTGYTGEDGFEIYIPGEQGVELFEQLAETVRPCGLAARDVLRIEAGFPLYGNEISEDITPLEANLDRFVDLSKDFVGKEAMLSRKVRRKLFGLELLSRGVPRRGHEILREGRPVGVVSSGTFSPTLNRGIALCFVNPEERKEGNRVTLRIRDREAEALLRSYPFVKTRRS